MDIHRGQKWATSVLILELCCCQSWELTMPELDPKKINILLDGYDFEIRQDVRDNITKLNRLRTNIDLNDIRELSKYIFPNMCEYAFKRCVNIIIKGENEKDLDLIEPLRSNLSVKKEVAKQIIDSLLDENKKYKFLNTAVGNLFK